MMSLAYAIMFVSFTCFGQSDDVYFSDGYAQFQHGDFEQAVMAFNKSIESGEHLARSYKYRGLAKYELYNFKGAESDLRKHIDLEPNSAKNYLPLAKFYFLTGAFKKSINELDRAILIDPFLAEAYNLRGMNFQSLSQSYDRDNDYFNKAFIDFNKAINIDSTFAWAYNNRGAARYYNQDVDEPSERDIEKAIADFEQALYYRPDLPKVLRNAGMAKAMIDRYDEAFKDIDRAIWLAPDDAENYLIRARAYNRMEKYDLAIVDYEKAIELNDLLTDAYIELGKSLLESGKPQAAIGYLLLTLKVDPAKEPVVYYELSRCYAGLGDKQQMMSFLDKARKKDYFNRKTFKKFFTDAQFAPFRRDADFNSSVQKIRKSMS